MKYKTIMFLMFAMISTISTIIHAGVNSGSLIEAKQFNNSTFQIGDVKHSILTQVQFQSIHGDCWVLMDGQSIVGKDLATLTGMNNVPDARGQFLRSLDNGKGIDLNRVIATEQVDDFKSHTHIQNQHNHLSGHGRADGFPYSSESLYGTLVTGPAGAIPTQASGNYGKRYAYTSSVTAVNQNSGGIETRPKNIAVNMFIRVHNQCN